MASSSESRLHPLEWGAIAAIVMVWGVNNAAAKFATDALPPLFVAGIRFAIALVMLGAFIRPPLPPWRQVLPVMILVGPVHFGLIYVGFSLVHSISLLGVTLQLWVPLTALFAWLLLGERLNAAALAGIGLAFAGSAWMTLDPNALGDGVAVLVGLGASVCWALGTVLVRRMPPIKPLKLQALISLIAAPALLGVSFATEPHVVDSARHASVWVWLSVGFAGIVSTVGASALLFWLVQRRETGRVTPYLLATPLVTAVLGVGIYGDELNTRLIVGGLASMAGVAIVALSERRRVRLASEAASASPV
jgi:O-acetylserine/cysteine efflux transporter